MDCFPMASEMTRHDKTMVHDGSHLWGAKRRGLACNTGAVLRHLEKTGLAMSPAVGKIVKEDDVNGWTSRMCAVYTYNHIFRGLGYLGC